MNHLSISLYIPFLVIAHKHSHIIFGLSRVVSFLIMFLGSSILLNNSEMFSFPFYYYICPFYMDNYLLITSREGRLSDCLAHVSICTHVCTWKIVGISWTLLTVYFFSWPSQQVLPELKWLLAMWPLHRHQHQGLFSPTFHFIPFFFQLLLLYCQFSFFTAFSVTIFTHT